MDAWMGWAMVLEALLLSAVVALALAWSALRAVFHVMAAAPASPRLATALPARRTPAPAA